MEGGTIPGTKIKVNYIKSKIISTKGVNLGMRLKDNVYVPITLLIDRSIDPNKTVKYLTPVKITKLEIIEDKKIIETIIPLSTFHGSEPSDSEPPA